MTNTYLGHWLDLSGVEKQKLSRSLGASDAALRVAIFEGWRGGPLVEAVSRYLDVPLHILVDAHPFSPDPEVREVLRRVIIKGAKVRMKARDDLIKAQQRKREQSASLQAAA
jgi:hypothetical protein